jgi:hypothetical protein
MKCQQTLIPDGGPKKWRLSLAKKTVQQLWDGFIETQKKSQLFIKMAHETAKRRVRPR